MWFSNLKDFQPILPPSHSDPGPPWDSTSSLKVVKGSVSLLFCEQYIIIYVIRFEVDMCNTHKYNDFHLHSSMLHICASSKYIELVTTVGTLHWSGYCRRLSVVFEFVHLRYLPVGRTIHHKFQPTSGQLQTRIHTLLTSWLKGQAAQIAMI